MTTTSLPAVSAYSLVPTIVDSYPSTGAASFRSRARPCGLPSMMSIRTPSPRPFSSRRIAAVWPTNPLPTTVIFMATRSPCVRESSGYRRHQIAGVRDRRLHRSWLPSWVPSSEEPSEKEDDGHDAECDDEH